MTTEIPYQLRDFEIVDYQLWPLRDKDKDEDKVFILRGPKPPSLEKDQYFACLGPAATFGCYTTKPYSLLLAERLSLPCLNLGISGASSTFYIQPENHLLLDLANRSRFVIILVMSGRSHTSSLCEAPKVGSLTGPKIMNRYKRLFQQDKSYFQQIVAELRQSFINDYISLSKKLNIPKVLLYFSNRNLQYKDDFSKGFATAHQGFPHFINQDVVTSIIPYFDNYVECVSSRGFPQELISRFTGKPVTNSKGSSYNGYYPCPEMHEDAMEALLPICRQYV